MKIKIFYLMLLFILFPYILFPKDMCFVMTKYIRPYKNLIDALEKKGIKGNFIVKEENFWQINDCKNIISFGEDSFKILSKRNFSTKKRIIYTFLTYPYVNLRKNEILLYLQPDPEFIIKNFEKIIPNTSRWLSFYSTKEQKKYLKSASKILKIDNKTLLMYPANTTINLNKILNTVNYDVFWFIPDPLFSSVYLVEYLLDKLLLYKKFTIGFNKFFYDSGATVSFMLDYEKTASLIKDILINFKGGKKYSFVHKVLVNKRNLEYLGKNK